MATQVFTVLYTHQKTKKAKTWQDGVLKISTGGNQATLYCDKGQRLDSIYIKTGKVNPGDDLESDRYLITVEAEGTSSKAPESLTESKDVVFNRSEPAGLFPLGGLKRKFTGFQCPREVPKKPCVDMEKSERAPSIQLAQGCSSLSSRLSTTSPLFAVPYVKKTGEVKSSNQPAIHFYTSEQDNSMRWRNKNVNENTLSNNTAGSGEQVGNINVFADGSRSTRILRSTPEILALLRSQPKTGSLCNIGDELTERAPVNADNTCLRSTFTRSPNFHSVEGETNCQEQSVGKPIPMNSRWNIYLDQSPASNARDAFELLSSPDKRLNWLQNTGLDQEGFKTEATCYLEEEKVHMNDCKPNDLWHEAKLLHLQVYNAVHSQNNSCKSEEYPFSEPCFPHNSTELEMEEHHLMEEHEKNSESFSEVTFNLMDNFDFTELEDGNSDVDILFPGLQSKNDVVDLNVENSVSEKKDPDDEKKTDIISLISKKETNDTHCTPPTLAVIGQSSEKSNPVEHSVFNKMPESGICDQQTQADEHRELTLLLSSKIQEFKGKECIPFDRTASKSTEALQLECLPSGGDDLLEWITDKSLAQMSVLEIPIEEAYCSETDSPGLPHSGSCISLLKILTKPCNALECLNILNITSSSASEKRQYESEICLQTGPQEGQRYISHHNK